MNQDKIEISFPVGTIVTLKTHPLLYNLHIRGDGKLVPPFMIVKEVFVESKSKNTHSEELGEQIAERVKYTCVFFDDNKTEFKEVILYQSMLKDFNAIYIARMDENKKLKDDNYLSLIQEVKNYKKPNYKYGKVVFFRTKKFEILKKRISIKNKPAISDSSSKKMNKKNDGENKQEKSIQYIVNYSSPEFVLCGIKNNEVKEEYYPNGNTKRKVSETLFKVKWFNSSQMKFSDVYLPIECFTDEQPFKSEVEYNSYGE